MTQPNKSQSLSSPSKQTRPEGEDSIDDPAEKLGRDSDRPESDGEDFNRGGASRSRPESTGEDF